MITASGVPLPTTVEQMIASIERNAKNLPHFRKLADIPAI